MPDDSIANINIYLRVCAYVCVCVCLFISVI